MASMARVNGTKEDIRRGKVSLARNKCNIPHQKIRSRNHAMGKGKKLIEKIKILEAEVKQTSEFLSHDLRSCMVSVCGFTALLCGEAKKTNHGKKSRHYLERIEQNIRTMDRQIQTRIKQTKSALVVQDFDAIGSIKDILSFIDTLARKVNRNGESMV